MRVVYVGPIPPIPGGIAQHGQQLVAALRGDGHEVEVVTWRSQFPPLLYRGRQVRVTDKRLRPWLRWWNPLSWLRAARLASAFDAAVISTFTPLHAIAVRSVVGRARTTVVVVHNPIPHEWFPAARFLTRWSLSRADMCIVHGDANQRQLSALLPSMRVVALDHPPNLPIGPSELPTLPPVRTLFLGYIRPYKGVEISIEAIDLLRRQGVDVTLTVAGHTWIKPEALRRLVETLGVAEHIHFRFGYVDDEEVGELLARHHILVAPYRSATASGVIPLALAAGRPVVSTRVGAIPEVVKDGETGTLAEPNDSVDFSKAMRRAIDDLPALARRAPLSQGSWQDFSRAIMDASGTNGLRAS